LTPWYSYIAWFFAGAFLVNTIPHVVQGVSGNKFQTPFASPRGVGESSAQMNVIWGASIWLSAACCCTSVPDPGCVKTQTSRECAELFSLLSSFDSG
jgi:hypothetical protein